MIALARYAVPEVEWLPPRMSDVVGSFRGPRIAALEVVWAFVRTTLFVFGVAELMAMRQQKHPLAGAFALGTLAFFVLAFFGNGVEFLRAFGPARLAAPLMLMLTLPASAFLADLCLKPGSLRLLVFGWILWVGASWQAVHNGNPRPIRSRLSPQETRLVTAIRHLPRERRILVQYDPGVNDALRTAVARSGHSFVGFPATWRNSTFSRSTLFEGRLRSARLFGTPAARFESAALADALSRYNIGTAIVTVGVTRAFLEAHPSIFTPRSSAANEDGPWLYDVNVPDNGFVVAGGGRATAALNRIRVRGARGNAVLGFHWIDGLRTEPPLPLMPRYLGNDAAPFIAVDNTAGVPAFEIVYDPR